MNDHARDESEALGGDLERTEQASASEIEERNRADSLAYQAEKIVRESGDKLPADLKAEVEEKTKALQEALKANDMPKVRETQTALQDALNRAGQAVYTAAQAEAGGPGAGPDTDGQPGESGEPGAGGQPGGNRPGTVEGEYREV